MRQLIVSVHWTDEDTDTALERVRKAYGPLKAEGTTGIAVAYGNDDEAHAFYDEVRDIAENGLYEDA